MLLGSVCSKLCSLLEIRHLFEMAFLQTHDWGLNSLRPVVWVTSSPRRSGTNTGLQLTSESSQLGRPVHERIGCFGLIPVHVLHKDDSRTQASGSLERTGTDYELGVPSSLDLLYGAHSRETRASLSRCWDLKMSPCISACSLGVDCPASP